MFQVHNHFYFHPQTPQQLPTIPHEWKWWLNPLEAAQAAVQAPVVATPSLFKLWPYSYNA